MTPRHDDDHDIEVRVKFNLQDVLAQMEGRLAGQITGVKVSVDELANQSRIDVQRLSKVEDRTKWMGKVMLVVFTALAGALAAHIWVSSSEAAPAAPAKPPLAIAAPVVPQVP